MQYYYTYRWSPLREALLQGLFLSLAALSLVTHCILRSIFYRERATKVVHPASARIEAFVAQQTGYCSPLGSLLSS
jgi:hypothetical protein